MEASRAVSWEGGKDHPFHIPYYLSTRFAGRFVYFFFSPTPIFSPFSHNAEPGPRLINTRILKFKSQLTFALFVAVNHVSGPRRKQRLTSGGFRSVLCASVFQGSLLVIVIVIDGREKRNCEGGFLNFRIRLFLKSVVRNFL